MTAASSTYRLLLDTSSLMFRAFFSVPQSVVGSDGRPVNAVYGYLGSVEHLVASRKPDETISAWDDDWRPAPRVELYAGYKAHRPPDPEGLPEQFEVLREVLDAFGLPVAEAPGWEAEDAVGALCAAAGARDRADIVTGDRDLIQLVRDPAVRVLFTVRGVSELRELDEAGVLAHFGVPASRYAEFALLRGDPSDGLPGVRGVGEKTARQLIQAYPSLDAMLEDAARPQPRTKPLKGAPQLRARLREAAEYLEAVREVVRIRTEADVVVHPGRRDDARLDELAELHKLGGPVGRLHEALEKVSRGPEAGGTAPPPRSRRTG
ncbi:MAG: 5'-3' exonuclease [Actinomycetota bacterium]|nr:5'-3' exonuclease [Actinomycetota bacterium]